MSFETRFRTVLAVAICLSMPLIMNGMASAEPAASLLQSPEMQSLMRAPAVQKAIAAARKGDSRQALAYFREAAQQGNGFAQVALGRMYFEGRGVPKNYLESLKWLKRVVDKNKQPTLSLAVDTLNDMSNALRRSPDPAVRNAGIMAALLPLLENPSVQQYLKNAAQNLSHVQILSCFGMVCM